MKQIALLACLPLLVSCARSGENPLPIKPLQPRADYDLEASKLLIQVSEGGPHTLRIKAGADVWIWARLCNVGLKSIHGTEITQSLEINGKIVRPPQFGEFSRSLFDPGKCNSGSLSLPEQADNPAVWGFKPEEPGRYEFRYVVHLRQRLEEENLANNEIVVVVEVVQ